MSEEIDKHVLRKYHVCQKLGKGAYGIVWKAIERRSNDIVALKKIFDAFQNSTDAQRTFREVMFLQELNDHENIIKLLNVLKAENDRDLYLVFEYMETDLHAVIRANILEEVHKQFIMYQLFKSLKYLHSAELLHRDIKPSNLLLDSDCQVKLADFGLARSIAQLKDDTGQSPILTDYVATRWSFRKAFPTASPEAEDLLRRLLHFNPHKRITAEQALQHPYLAQFHNPMDEPGCNRVIRIPIDDNTKFTIQEYRERLYSEIVRRKKEIRRKLREKERLERDSSRQSRRSKSRSSGNT